jgi:hypothetical protein
MKNKFNFSHLFLVVAAVLLVPAESDAVYYNLGAFWRKPTTTPSTLNLSDLQRLVSQSQTLRDTSQFGSSVAMSEDGLTLVIGAPNDSTDDSGNAGQTAAGSAFVYSWTVTGWRFQQKLTGQTGDSNWYDHLGGDNYGNSVSISGTTIVVGASSSSYDCGGSAISLAGKAFVYTNSGGTWTFQQTLCSTGTNAHLVSDGFGTSVSISGDTIVAGTVGQDYDASGGNLLSGAGAAYVFTRSGTTWTQQQKLVGTGTNGRMAGDGLGGSVAISGDTVAVGAKSQGYDAAGANLISGAGAVYVFTRSGSTWTLQQKIVGTGTNARVASDSFGYAVALSSDTLVATSPNQGYDATGANLTTSAGAAFVYLRSGTTWTQQQKLVGTGTNGRIANDNFGSSAAISVDTVVVGATGQGYDDLGGNFIAGAGAAYVYLRSGTTWTQQQKLVATGTNARVAGDQFGSGVGLSGDYAAVGASLQDYDVGGANSKTSAGAAFTFTRTAANWAQDARFDGSIYGRTYGNFGNSVALSEDGTTLVVGASRDSYDGNGQNYLSDAGAVFVYLRSGNTWTFQQKLAGTGTNGRVSNDRFGTSVAIYGNTIVVGAFQQDYDASGANSVTDAGAAYVYTRSGTTWTFQQKLVGTGTNARIANDAFGSICAIYLDTIVVGAYGQNYDASGANPLTYAGAAYVYTRSGTTWTQQQKLVGTGTNSRIANDFFAQKISLYLDTIIVGASGQAYDASGANLITGAGAAFIFFRSGTTWTLQQKLVATGTNARLANDAFGYSVGLSGDTAVIGAYQDNYDSTGANPLSSAGSAYIFIRSGTTWTQQARLTPTGTNARVSADIFGFDTAVAGDVAIIGAYHQSYDAAGANSISNAGAAFTFIRSGTTWTQQDRLVGTGLNSRVTSDYFGQVTAISGDAKYIAAGSFNQSYDAYGGKFISNAGAVWVTGNDPTLPSTTTSTITGTGPIAADGVTNSTITITLKSAAGAGIAGITPSFNATDTGGKNFQTLCAATNSGGVSTCQLRSTHAETKTLCITGPIAKCGGTVAFQVGSASVLAFSTQPVANYISQNFLTMPTVSINDAYGNTVSTASATISLAAYTDSTCTTAAGGTLTSSPTATSSGIAPFSGIQYNNTTAIYLKATGGGYTAVCSNLVQFRKTIAFIASANGISSTTSVTVNVPAGTATGHVMIAAISVRGGQRATVPSGWIDILGTSSTNLGVELFYRVATGSEPASYSFSYATSAQSAGVIATYSGVDTTTPEEGFTSWLSSTTTITGSSISMGETDQVYLGVYAIANDSAITLNASLTSRAGTATAGNPASSRTRIMIGDKAFSAAGATGSFNSTAGTAAENIGAMIGLRRGYY